MSSQLNFVLAWPGSAGCCRRCGLRTLRYSPVLLREFPKLTGLPKLARDTRQSSRRNSLERDSIILTAAPPEREALESRVSTCSLASLDSLHRYPVREISPCDFRRGLARIRYRMLGGLRASILIEPNRDRVTRAGTC